MTDLSVVEYICIHRHSRDGRVWNDGSGCTDTEHHGYSRLGIFLTGVVEQLLCFPYFYIASPIIKILAMLCRPATMDLNLERRKDFTLLAQTLMSTFFHKQSSCLGVLDVGWSVLLTLLSYIFIVQYFRPC